MGVQERWRGFWETVGAIPSPERHPSTTDSIVSLTRAPHPLSGALLKGIVPDRIWEAMGAIPRPSAKVDKPQK